MTKFSSRYDAKAAKDSKGKGKVNPPSIHSQNVIGTVTGSNAGGGVKAASATRDPPSARKASVVKKGEEIRQNKRARTVQGENIM
jgi:hypothetical protein